MHIVQVAGSRCAKGWVRLCLETEARSSEVPGALHHRWAFGDDVVVIIDEWPNAAEFQKFFDTQRQTPVLMQAAGVLGPPTFEILEAKTGPDEL